jgi:hypothetical protein
MRKNTKIKSQTHRHRKQGPIFVANKIITQPSTYVKFAIKFEITANPVTNSKFVDDFVMNKNRNQIFKVYVDC